MTKITVSIAILLSVATYGYTAQPAHTKSVSAAPAAQSVKRGVNDGEGDDYLNYSIPPTAYKIGPKHDRDRAYLLINYLDHKPSPGKADDRLIGTDMLLARTNRLIERDLYKNEKRHGVQRKWYENGTLKSEEPYRNGVMHGVFKCWDETGKLVGCYKMINGTGVKKIYYSNGRLREECGYQNNSMHGMRYTFYDNGQITSLEEFKHGALVGNSFSFYPTGAISTVCACQQDATKDTARVVVVVSFDENGEIDDDVVYRIGWEEVSKDKYLDLAKANPKILQLEQNPTNYKNRVDDRIRAVVKRYKESLPVKIPLECPKEEAK